MHNAEDVEKVWRAYIDKTATGLMDYLDGDGRRLEGMVWTAMINSCLARLSVQCGSIRHATCVAHTVPGWQVVSSATPKSLTEETVMESSVKSLGSCFFLSSFRGLHHRHVFILSSI